MDYAKLYETMERKRREGENLSFPFLVQTGGGKMYYVWFSFDVTGNMNTGAFVHINKITILREDNTTRSVSAAFDTPYLFDPNNRENRMEYLRKLVLLQDSFSEEEMNHLLQDYGMKSLFHAFQCVRNYVRTHESELIKTKEDEVSDRSEKIKAAAEKLMASVNSRKTGNAEIRSSIEKALTDKEEMDILGDQWSQFKAVEILQQLAGKTQAQQPYVQPSGRFCPAPAQMAHAESVQEDPMVTIGKLKQLLDAGLISQQKYDEKVKSEKIKAAAEKSMSSVNSQKAGTAEIRTSIEKALTAKEEMEILGDQWSKFKAAEMLQQLAGKTPDQKPEQQNGNESGNS